jgi:AmiR/NasT family two-component response regulator
MLAEQGGLDMGQAFSRLRNHARNHNVRLVDVAQSFIDGTLTTSTLDPPRPAPNP